MPATIYLHWAATPYTWVRSGLYHTIISGDGRLNRLHAYSNGPASGGDELRARIRRFMADPEVADGAELATNPLSFRRATSIIARGEELTVELDANGSSWALAADLFARYEIPYEWDANHRRVLVGSLDVAPSFSDDQVQPSVGWPLYEMTLQSGNAPVILRGILREDRAWCRALEFAEEFGISVSFEPFTLWERRGG